MDITITINDELFEAPVKEAVGRRINEVVRNVVDKKIDSYKGKIEYAVEVYLAKRLTDKEILSEIDKSIARVVEERIRD